MLTSSCLRLACGPLGTWPGGSPGWDSTGSSPERRAATLFSRWESRRRLPPLSSWGPEWQWLSLVRRWSSLIPPGIWPQAAPEGSSWGSVRRFGRTSRGASPRPGWRPSRLREYVLALRSIWSAWQEGSPLRFEGDHYRFSLMTPFFNPGPIDHPDVPVFAAAVGLHMARLAGEVCDGIQVHPFHTVRYLDEVLLPAVQRGAVEAGRDPGGHQVAAAVFVATGRTDEQIEVARETARRQIAFYASTPAYRPVLDLHGWEIGPKLSALSRRREWESMATLIDDRMIDELSVTGRPETLGRLIREKYGNRLHRIGFYGAGPGTTIGLDDEDWSNIISEIHSGSGRSEEWL